MVHQNPCKLQGQDCQLRRHQVGFSTTKVNVVKATTDGLILKKVGKLSKLYLTATVKPKIINNVAYDRETYIP